MNESLNVGLWAEVWTYWKIPLKQEKHPHKWSTIDYNSIIAGTFEIFSEVIEVAKCGPIARIDKQAMS